LRPQSSTTDQSEVRLLVCGKLGRQWRNAGEKTKPLSQPGIHAALQEEAIVCTAIAGRRAIFDMAANSDKLLRSSEMGHARMRILSGSRDFLRQSSRRLRHP
jgi:hypothetical protein